MTIKFLNNDGTAEFFLEGRLDSTNANEAETLLLNTVVEKNFTDVILDLGELEYVSSAGLRIFMKMYMRLRKKGGTISIRNTPEGIMDVFEMTGFVSLFKFI